MLTIAAWYDLFQDGSLRNYIGVKAQGGTEAARRGQQPRRHCRRPRRERAERSATWTSARRRTSTKTRVTLDLVRLPVQGRAERVRGKAREAVRDGREPVARRGRLAAGTRAGDTKYFLHSTARRIRCVATERCRRRRPRAEAADIYVYDPANPVPTIGGPLCCDGAHLKPGPRDQRPVEATRRCAGVFDAAAGSGHGSDRARDAGAVREVVRGRHRLHRQARGRVARTASRRT